VIVEQSPTGRDTASPGRRPPRLIGLVAGLVVASATAGIGVGVAIGHHFGGTAPAALLVPAPDDRGSDPAGDRAIALVVGRTRASDHMTFDQWYRTRLSRLAPGNGVAYIAQLSGSRLCGEWRISAVAVPGPLRGGRAALDVLKRFAAIASVDEVTGKVVGLDERTAGMFGYDISTHCSIAPASSHQTWLDQFDGGAVP
jgi:hypothetical protein